MAPKPPTVWEIAKPLLEKDYLEGRVTDDMKRAFVHQLRDEFKVVPINRFGANWLRMKKTIGSMRQHATRDAVALEHDRQLYPVNEERWDQSEAMRLLKEDIENEFHHHFEPEELWLSRAEYRKFDLAEFRPHIQR